MKLTPRPLRNDSALFAMRCPARSKAPWAFVLMCALIGCTESQPPPDPASLEIQNRILSVGIPRRVVIRGDSIYSFELIRTFYEGRSYRPAWSAPNGILPDADSLVDAIKGADREGLRPQEYHLAALESILMESGRPRQGQEGLNPSTRADLDLLLTDAFLLYASHLSEGRIDPDSLQVRWFIGKNDLQLDTLLEQSLQSRRIKESIQALVPRHSLYSDLRELLSSFNVMARRGRWGTVPAGPSLKGGDIGRRVFALKNRLWFSGELVSRSGAGSDEFDSTLADAVRGFQKRHGLEASGVADSASIVALNVPLEDRIEQIKINMERWRWMPHTLGRRHMRVNIPDFKLTVSEDGREVMSMKLVLGLPDWQTPVFSSAMNQVLFNWHWLAPKDIVKKELINYMKADSNYLRSNEMSLWRQSGDSLVKINLRPDEIALIQPKDIDFRLRQEGGPQNIMGQVKFLIPNEHSVYLHDTPYRDDFAKSVRMLSHGCIRLEKPFDLAEYVLREFPDWRREKIDTVVAHKTGHSIYLKNPIPVHITYCTVWKERDGSVQFRVDCYGLDRRLGAALLPQRK
ncbi:MAG: L,D-transpeptidase family protein [Ignavibacteria bacterium]|nr:L,D-transpeptidase family protein [Ignavibacteria bacterium]